LPQRQLEKLVDQQPREYLEQRLEDQLNPARFSIHALAEQISGK
jgi:hypothetical protein